MDSQVAVTISCTAAQWRTHGFASPVLFRKKNETLVSKTVVSVHFVAVWP